MYSIELRILIARSNEEAEESPSKQKKNLCELESFICIIFLLRFKNKSSFLMKFFIIIIIVSNARIG